MQEVDYVPTTRRRDRCGLLVFLLTHPNMVSDGAVDTYSRTLSAILLLGNF